MQNAPDIVETSCLLVPLGHLRTLTVLSSTLAALLSAGCFASHEDGDFCCDIYGSAFERDGDCPGDTDPVVSPALCSPALCCAPDGSTYDALCCDRAPCNLSDSLLARGESCEPSSSAVACCDVLGARSVRDSSCLEGEVEIGLDEMCTWMQPPVLCCADGTVTERLSCMPGERELRPGESCETAMPGVRCCDVEGMIHARARSCERDEHPLRSGEACEPIVAGDPNVHTCGQLRPLPEQVFLRGSGCCPPTECRVTQRGQRIDIQASVNYEADVCDCVVDQTEFEAFCDYSEVAIEAGRDYRVFLNGRPLERGAIHELEEDESGCRTPGVSTSPGCDDSAFDPDELRPAEACWRQNEIGRPIVEAFFDCLGCQEQGVCEARTEILDSPAGAQRMTEVRFTQYADLTCGGLVCPPVCIEGTSSCILPFGAVEDGARVLVNGVEVDECPSFE